MKSFLSILLLVCFVSTVTIAQSTQAQAEALVKKAVQYYKENGKDAAFKEITNKEGKFVTKDLYVFVLDFKGATLAHGGTPALVGKDMIGVQDPDGKFFLKDCIELAKAKGKGWVDYKFNNPTTKKIEAKTTYVEKADTYVFGCGVYKK